MPEKKSGSILILDDDSAFRDLIGNLLRHEGYQVVEAGSPEEATAMFSNRDTALAIVDYRLPQMDGMSWITNLRNAGGNTPIIFCSAIPCDTRTFNWLRNILQVALIIQKPIVPSTFLQQVESLLPGYEKTCEGEGIAAARGAGGSETSVALADQEIRHLAKKLKIEQAVREARMEYLKQLEGDWKMLTQLVDEFNNDRTAVTSLQQATLIAHSVRGTAGSLGLEKIGEVAGKLEDFLYSLDPRDASDQEIYWSEIIRGLATGNDLIHDAMSGAVEIPGKTTRNRVLILSQNQSVIDSASEEETLRLAHVQGTDNAGAFLRYAAEHRIDAAIIDTVPDAEAAYEHARMLREIPGNEALPLALICPNKLMLSPADRTYVGASDVLYAPVSGADLRESVEKLLRVSTPGQPRLLVIDDDEVLCRFVSGVLTDQRMEVTYQTSPVEALAAVEKVKPDIILLDLMMPMMTGYEVCRQIRTIPEVADVPVIILTSKTSQEARSAAFAVGATDFLTKPVLAEELQARVSAHLASAMRKRRERARDTETGMLRGDAFMIEAEALRKMAVRTSQSLALAIVEMDDFDELTIVQGHYGSHSAAVHLGLMLQHRFSAETLRARWSGSGYALAVPDTDTGALAGALERLLADFSACKFAGSANKFVTTFSAGVADSNKDGDDMETIIKAAHHRLRTARRVRHGVVASV
ncbi:MAG: response regulator [Candidatus Obscuribacterales bacterium]